MELLAEDADFIILKSCDSEETETIGKLVGTYLEGGDVVSLVGELGAGKTCFTRGIARGLGIGQNVHIVSPSFTLINEYPGKLPLFHFDFYRLDDSERIFELGYQEYFYGNGVVVIEWGDKVANFLPEQYLGVYFSSPEDEVREINIKGNGKRFCDIIKKIGKVIYSMS